MTRSIIMVTILSTNRPITAAESPRKKAITALTAAVRRPIRILMDRPATVLINISRPIQSVPKRYLTQGSIFFLEKSVSMAASLQKYPITVTAERNTTAPMKHIAVICRLFPIMVWPPPPGFSDPQRRKEHWRPDSRKTRSPPLRP